MSRIIESRQLEIDHTEIASIKFDVKSRDDGSRYVVGSPYWVDVKNIMDLKPKE